MSRLSLRSAIDAMCKSCIYDPGSGNGGWREQVAGCSSSNCPLHCVRPLPIKATKPAAERENNAARVVGGADPRPTHAGQIIGLYDGAAEERQAA